MIEKLSTGDTWELGELQHLRRTRWSLTSLLSTGDSISFYFCLSLCFWTFTRSITWICQLWTDLQICTIPVIPFMCSFRTFRLHLKHDSEALSQNFTVITENGPIPADISHMYSGILEGGFSHGIYSSKLNYDGYSLVSSLFLSICCDLKANCASLISAFWPLHILTLDLFFQVNVIPPAMVLCFRVSLREPSMQEMTRIT